jgi:hypothetical protein
MTRIYAGLALMLILGACASSGPLAPLPADERAALREACGPIPSASRIKAAQSPREVRYRICKRELLEELEDTDRSVMADEKLNG